MIFAAINDIARGAYAFGRTTSKAIVEVRRKRVRRGLRRAQTDWDVLLKDQDEGYITWAEFTFKWKDTAAKVKSDTA